MKNKKVQAMLATTIVSAALAGGCGFNPAEEEMAEVYGPAPYEEVTTTEEKTDEEETKEQVSENNVNKEEETQEEVLAPEEIFAPEEETEMCIYGPAPTE